MENASAPPAAAPAKPTRRAKYVWLTLAGLVLAGGAYVWIFHPEWAPWLFLRNPPPPEPMRESHAASSFIPMELRRAGPEAIRGRTPKDEVWRHIAQELPKDALSRRYFNDMLGNGIVRFTFLTSDETEREKELRKEAPEAPYTMIVVVRFFEPSEARQARWLGGGLLNPAPPQPPPHVSIYRHTKLHEEKVPQHQPPGWHCAPEDLANAVYLLCTEYLARKELGWQIDWPGRPTRSHEQIVEEIRGFTMQMGGRVLQRGGKP